MNRLIAVGFMLLGLCMAGSAVASGDPEAGQQKAAPCAACHGPDGNSTNGEWPKLAGQHPQYTEAQLKAFKEGKRQNPLMTPMAMGLSEEDMADVAAYFAKQRPQVGGADPELVEAGAKIYRGGNKESGVSACMACHGPRGSGNGPAGYPRIAGQHAAYTKLQLEAYRSGARNGTPASQIMKSIASRMSNQEIEAVSSYIEGLH
ncbi:MAG TPA: c-type cytochrome [Candidatus Macondimonas sp.]|mgnify:CR=1 FL=1|nr:c-type cytochrome [Candidatus Macondimonas sp.]